MGKNIVCGGKITSKRRKSQFDINMTVVLKSTQKLVLISNFFLTIFVKW